MPYITDQTSETQFNIDLSTFLNNATTNKAILGLSSTDLSDMGKIFGDFSTGLTNTNSAKATLKTTTADKNNKKNAAKATVTKFAKIWRANPLVPDTVLDALMLPNHATPGTKTPPTQPTEFKYSLNDKGVIGLSWKRNGNKAGTIFSVEVASNPTGPWTIFDVTSTTKMDYPGRAGEETWFRVSAKRNGQTSIYSVLVSVWADSQIELVLAA